MYTLPQGRFEFANRMLWQGPIRWLDERLMVHAGHPNGEDLILAELPGSESEQVMRMVF